MGRREEIRWDVIKVSVGRGSDALDFNKAESESEGGTEVTYLNYVKDTVGTWSQYADDMCK